MVCLQKNRSKLVDFLGGFVTISQLVDVKVFYPMKIMYYSCAKIVEFR